MTATHPSPAAAYAATGVCLRCGWAISITAPDAALKASAAVVEHRREAHRALPAAKP